MRIGKRAVVGLLSASLLFPVPALAIQSRAVKATKHVKTKAAGSATEIIQSQYQDRLNYISFSRSVRAEFRGGGPALQASVNRYLRNVLLELRRSWRIETRTGIASPFGFPDV